MAKVIFGVYGGKVIDNRNRRIFEIEELPEFHNFDAFNPGNPIKAFIGGYGFFIFEKGVNLLHAAHSYIERAAAESCGKCTPCRVGTQLIKEKLEALTSGRGGPLLLDEIKDLAAHVKNTSLCGLGQTAAAALLEMIKYFREELEKEIEAAPVPSSQTCTTYVTAPCIEACPSKVDVPRYIDYVKDGKFTHSVGVILQKYPMAATCGRVCVRFCEMACRRTQVDEAVGIKILKRFVADHETDMPDKWFGPDLIENRKSPDLKIAVVGAGPAGVSAAYHLLLRGFPVDVFEALPDPGGMASVGIPSYRLPKDVLRKEIDIICSLGGRIFYNQRMGLDFKLKDLFTQGYQAVFLGVGAHLGKSLGVAGEDELTSGYEHGVSLLLRINHDYINRGLPVALGEKVVVIGGGNVAMDCVRSAVRLGVKEVHLVYRRSRAEMPADPDEIEGAEKEGVIFHFLSHPRQFLHENGRVKGMELIKMKLGAPDGSGRRGVIPIEGSEYNLDADYIIPAIGQQVDFSFALPDDGVSFNKWGLIETSDESLMTDRRGVFAGGDCVTGPATLIQAMAQGEKAARCIDDYLTYGRVRFSPQERMSELISSLQPMVKKEMNTPVRHLYRVKVKELDPEVRKKIFEEVEEPISLQEAYHEASRCMRCYSVAAVITQQ